MKAANETKTSIYNIRKKKKNMISLQKNRYHDIINMIKGGDIQKRHKKRSYFFVASVGSKII